MLDSDNLVGNLLGALFDDALYDDVLYDERCDRCRSKKTGRFLRTPFSRGTKIELSILEEIKRE